MKKALFLLILCALGFSLKAQTQKQNGTVREITREGATQIVPVKGVRVVVGNEVSKPSNGKGAFSLLVPQQYQINGVRSSQDYQLALPTKGATYYADANDVDVIVIDPTRKETDYKALYANLQRSHREKEQQLLDEKRQLNELLSAMEESDARYAETLQQRDSLQELYLEYVNNEDAIREEMQRIAEELALTDYVSLDNLNRRIYSLKCQGQWDSISLLLHQEIGSNVASYIQQALDRKKTAEANLATAQALYSNAAQDLARRFRYIEQAIEAFKMQHLNDSVSRYYEILTNADPMNWNNLDVAGTFEKDYMANFDKAMGYYHKALLANIDEMKRCISYGNIACTHCFLGNYDTAMYYFREAHKWFIQANNKEEKAFEAVLFDNIGSCFREMGDFDSALFYCEKALQIWIAENGSDNNRTSIFLVNKGALHNVLKNIPQALDCYQKAFQIAKELGAEGLNLIGVCNNNIGMLYNNLGEQDSALHYCRLALASWQPIYPQVHPNIMIVYSNMGTYYASNEQLDSALYYLTKSTQIQAALFGENHISAALLHNNIGSLYFKQGNIVDAIRHIRTALTIYETAEGGNPLDIGTACNNLSVMYANQSVFDSALFYSHYAKRIITEVFGKDSPNLASCFQIDGYLYKESNQLDSSLVAYQKAIDILSSLDRPNYLQLAVIYHNKGTAYYDRGDIELSIQCYLQSVTLIEEKVSPQYPQLSDFYTHLADSYSDLGDEAKAKEYRDKAKAIEDGQQ